MYYEKDMSVLKECLHDVICMICVFVCVVYVYISYLTGYKMHPFVCNKILLQPTIGIGPVAVKYEFRYPIPSFHILLDGKMTLPGFRTFAMSCEGCFVSMVRLPFYVLF